ncbi:MAG: family acetyltransferase [Arthrobacter sp.]|jgi:ribosomal-protein-alanine N-acetyltransferase|nr:family acetyltransferase [Arthrobacter sp.]
MSAAAELSVAVSLVDVGEDVLEHLLAVAIRDADADEVTPPLGSAAGWNSERISWFREYHRAATGLDGPARQKSWAISYDGELAGSIRLRWTGPGILETGIWLARGCRGRGIGHEALRQVQAHAAASGATALEADTTAGNGAALALLRGAGAGMEFDQTSDAAAAPVKARIPLR